MPQFTRHLAGKFAFSASLILQAVNDCASLMPISAAGCFWRSIRIKFTKELIIIPSLSSLKLIENKCGFALFSLHFWERKCILTAGTKEWTFNDRAFFGRPLGFLLVSFCYYCYANFCVIRN